MGEEWSLCRKIELAVSLLCAFSQISLISAFGQREASLFGAVEVVDYKHYSSIQLFRFLIPHQANRASWNFRAFTVPQDCAEKDIFIHLQEGSYPLVNRGEETFPADFYLDRTHELTISLASSNKSLSHTIHCPLPGEWYAAAYTTSLSDKILQKGVRPGCKYFLQPQLSAEIHEDIKTLDKRDGSLHVHARSQKIVRFFLDEPAWQYEVKVVGCGNPSDATLSSFHCNFTLRSRSSALPDQDANLAEAKCVVNTNGDCTLRVASPDVGSWQYLIFINHGQENINIQYVVESQVCSDTHANLVSEYYNHSDECYILPQLDRYRGYGDFRSKFGILILSTVILPQVFLYDGATRVIPVVLEPRLDIGATLKINITAETYSCESAQHAVVVGCVQRGSIAYTGGDGLPCEDKPSAQILINLTESVGSLTRVIYIPYPEPGNWYFTLRLICYDMQGANQRVYCDNLTTVVEIDISTSACVDGGCDNSGQCYTYQRGSSRFASCSCVAGWRGYGCSDGSQAVSFEEQLTEALLLTLSNLLFIPAILVALHRRFIPEALVYTCTMFFSAFYHACDGNRVLTLCITSFSTLSACDFFGSVLAFWVTLTAMLRVKEPYLPTIILAGVIGLLYGVLEDKHSLWLFVAPVISGITLLVISWGIRCHRRRSCYPSWRRYLFYLLPGVTCALIGLCLFAFVETHQNYKYVHSVWHVSMAISILFVLPPRPAWKGSKVSLKSTDHNCSQILTCNSVHSQDSDGGIVNMCMTETI